MAEFLVEIEIVMPSITSSQRSTLQSAELERGRELIATGVIERIWRMPGRRANVGVWRANDATELHEHLASLPMFAYMDIVVTPLAMHPLEA